MKIKRILSVLLALILALSMLPAAAQEEEAEFPIFDALGIQIDLPETDEITRYELAKLVISIANLEIITEGKAVYADVSETHWLFPEINTVTTYGYMGGLTNMTFKPEEKASVADAAQVFMNMLGYGNFGKQANWTTSDYFLKARSIGLLDGVSTLGGNVTPKAIKQMIANMLEQNIVTVASVSNEGVRFVVDKEMTYLQSVYGYYFKEGLMQAAGKSTLRGSNPVSNGKIKVNGVTYKAEGDDYSEYLGYEVRIVVDSNEENANVLYIEKVKDYSETELYIKAADITGYSNYKYSYRDEKGSIEQAQISPTSQIFLNGQKALFDEKIMKPLSGGVKLLDADDDEVYEMVYITYEIFYEVAGSYEDEYVADAISGKQLNIEDVDFVVYENGISAGMSAIVNENIVTVTPGAITFDPGSTLPYADNTNITRASIETTTTKVSGTVTGKSAGGCIVDETEYPYSAYYQMLVANGKVSMPSLNTYVIVYLNGEGEIVYSKIDTDAIIANKTEKYGYLIKAAPPSRGNNTKVFVKIFTEDATFIEGETADKIKFNGSNRDASDILSDATLFTGGVLNTQLITYETNEEGIVTAINTFIDYTATTPYEGYDIENFSKDYEGSNKYYNTFLHLYTIADETILFEIPSDLSKEKKFKVSTGKKVLSGNKTYYVELYDVDESYNISAILIDATRGSGSEHRSLPYNHSTGEINSFVVYDKNIVLNGKGDECVELTGITYSGTTGKTSKMEEKSLIPADDNLRDEESGTFGHIYDTYAGEYWNNLLPGDVIHYSVDEDGYVEKFRLVFREANMKDLSGNVVYKSKGVDKNSPAVYLVSGVIHKVYADGNFLYRTAAEKTVANINKARPFADQAAEVMIFIYENGKVRQGSASELRPEDAAFFISEYGKLYEVIVYR